MVSHVLSIPQSLLLCSLFSLKVDDGGLNAVARLAHGDMRRSLNLLQVRQSVGDPVFQLFSLVVNYYNYIYIYIYSIVLYEHIVTLVLLHSSLQSVAASHDVINELNVYSCAGHPLPSDIDRVLHALLNERLTQAVQSKYYTIRRLFSKEVYFFGSRARTGS